MSALGYSELKGLLHNINIGDITSHTCEIVNSKWIEGGIVNVKSDGSTITIITDGGLTVDAVNHNDGFFTFEMPGDNVTIDIS